MEDTSAVHDVRRLSGGSEPSAAPRDLRDWLARAEAIGQITRVREPIDWNEEMGAITYMAHQQIGAPAPLFENIKGCPSGFRALWNIIGSSVDRFALAIGEPSGLSAMDLIQRCRGKFTSTLSPVMVEADVAPVNANHRYGDEVDITIFPAARHWPGDGGRYIGTADAIITRDPGAGWLNVGCYRQMVHDRNHVGLYLSPGKDARLHIERYWSRNEPCEIVAVWGVDPAMFIAASLTFSKTISELEFIGGMTGRPVELVKGHVGSIPYPARAEIVIEGIVHPNAIKLEGPFGEFTGYYGRPEDYAFNVEDDVDPSNINQVLWAMSTRCNPVEDIDILRQTWSTWLDPTQNPPEERPYGSKALINACMEHRYIKQFSRRTKLRRSVYESLAARWTELGFTGTPPKLWSLEE